MTQDLRPKKWPHFMEKMGQKDREYRSHKVLGQLYDMVGRVDFVPVWEMPFDKRVLEAYDIEQMPPETISKIKQLKSEYDDAIRRIMAQHDIRTEFEVFTAFVMFHNFEKRDYNFAEELGRQIGAVKQRFQTECKQAAGANPGTDQNLLPFVAAMYAVTAGEVARAIAQWQKRCDSICAKNAEQHDLEPQKLPPRPAPRDMPLMSFPWIFARELGQIALAAAAAAAGGGGQPVTATGLDSQLPAPVLDSGPQRRMRPAPIEVASDAVQTVEGPIRSGEELKLFENHGKGAEFERREDPERSRRIDACIRRRGE